METDVTEVAPATPPRILCVMHLPPDLGGHGGSQRAWRLVKELTSLGEVHFVLVYNEHDSVSAKTSLEPLEPLVATVTRVSIAEWFSWEGKVLGLFHPQTVDVARLGSGSAPRFPKAALARIASQLPLRTADIIFAGRLPAAVIVQMLIDRRLLSASLRIVDFDDILSTLRLRQLVQSGSEMGIQGRALARLDAHLIKRAEDRIARDWDAVSVCSDEDVASLTRAYPQSKIVKVPNVVTHDLIAPRPPDHQFKCLFVGNLNFPPNAHGLKSFIENAWPGTVKAVPNAMLTIVGFNPSAELRGLAESRGILVHENVPDVRQYYSDCDVVIAPILFGGGTRVKIVEAMALGRPVVSTEIGAEGLGLEDGRQILLVDSIDGFPAALARLAEDGALRQSLVQEARRFQELHFGAAILQASMRKLFDAAGARSFVQERQAS